MFTSMFYIPFLLGQSYLNQPDFFYVKADIERLLIHLKGLLVYYICNAIVLLQNYIRNPFASVKELLWQLRKQSQVRKYTQ